MACIGMEELGHLVRARSVAASHSLLQHLARAGVGLLLIVLLSISMAPIAFAVDELYLTGVVKNINATTGMVYVEVSSLSCPGMKIFRADQLGKLEPYVEKRISFYIDSSKCTDNEVHTILTSWGIGR